ncbi:MAG: hypothetical protein JWM90_773 [Thermoleophilia bacterium]|nr:hypothetical protein [Thermoleophilia bacterium]
MAQHAPADPARPEAFASGASMSERAVPQQVADARDQLFRDADQHGPRAGELARRGLVASLVVPIALALAAWQPWRVFVIDLVPVAVADAALLVPVLASLVLLAALLAPLARMSFLPLIAVTIPLLAASTWLVSIGSIVLAAVPGTLGATILGLAAARALQRAVWALPVLLAAGISDTQSVRGGVTQELLDGAGVGAAVADVTSSATVRIAPDLVASIDFVVLHIPVASGTWMLGLVDVVALGLLLGLSHLFWLPVTRSAVALGVALVATHLVDTPIAVLPVLGIAWVLVNAPLVWRSTRFSVRRLMYLGG